MAHGKDAARDTRHGRRGGGWAPEPAREAKAGGVNTDLVNQVCPHCHRTYRAHPPKPGRPAAKHCGAVPCEAFLEWTDAQWEGRARMAAARRYAANGIVVDLVDREALRRFP